MQRTLRLDVGIESVQRHERLTQVARHLSVHLRDHVSCRGSGREGDVDVDVDGDSQRTEAVRVRRRNLKQGDVDGQNAVFEQRWNVREEDRREVGAAGLHGLAHIGTDEERIVADVAFQLRRDVWRGAVQMERDGFDVVQLAGAPRQALEQRRRRGGAAVNVDARTALQRREGFV